MILSQWELEFPKQRSSSDCIQHYITKQKIKHYIINILLKVVVRYFFCQFELRRPKYYIRGVIHLNGIQI